MRADSYNGVSAKSDQFYIVRYTCAGGGEFVTVRRSIRAFPSWWRNIIVSLVDITELRWVEPQNFKEVKFLQPTTGQAQNAGE